MAIIWDDKTKTHTVYGQGVKIGEVVLADFDKDKTIAACQKDIADKMVKENTMEVRILIRDKPTAIDANKIPDYSIGHGLKGFKWLA